MSSPLSTTATTVTPPSILQGLIFSLFSDESDEHFSHLKPGTDPLLRRSFFHRRSGVEPWNRVWNKKRCPYNQLVL